ncbi:hypothetical protein [Paraburkholderia humisilvae]|nr:hypothetical protein [Paraburkholderia humisilvae]
MLDRFLRNLAPKGVTLSTFGTAHVETFFADVDTRCAPGTTTRLRYASMPERLCRQLIDDGIREENPVTAFARFRALARG